MDSVISCPHHYLFFATRCNTRVQADEPLEDKTQWCATYEAQLQLPPGKQLIEIKLLSHNDIFPSLVLADWEAEVA